VSSKALFIEQLRLGLKKVGYSDTLDVLDYYDELFEDKREKGMSDDEILKDIGDIDEIINELRFEHLIHEAEARPSVKTTSKAWIAALGVLSIPMLIPVFILGVAGIATVLALYCAFFAVSVSLLLGGVSIFFSLIVDFFQGLVPIYSALTFMGIGILLVLLSLLLIRLAVKLVSLLMKWASQKLRTLLKKGIRV
jgi:uncharacterized membrane protein